MSTDEASAKRKRKVIFFFVKKKLIFIVVFRVKFLCVKVEGKKKS